MSLEEQILLQLQIDQRLAALDRLLGQCEVVRQEAERLLNMQSKELEEQ